MEASIKGDKNRCIDKFNIIIFIFKYINLEEYLFIIYFINIIIKIFI
jgi:hypothetical protein